MSTVSDYFGCMVFDDRVMKANLSPFVNTLHKKSFLSLDRLTRPDKLNIIISEA